MTIDKLTIAVNRVASDASVSTPTATPSASVTQEDLQATGAGSLVLDVTAGNLVLNAGTSSTATVLTNDGNVRLNAANGNLAVNAGVLSTGAGNLTLLSSGTQIYAANGDLSALGGGTIDVQATGSASTIGMDAGTVFQTHGGNIRVMAGTTLNPGGTITLGVLDARMQSDRTGNTLTSQATWGSVSIASTGGSILDNSNDTATNVFAKELKLSATPTGASALGASGNHIETEVVQFSAAAGIGGFYMTDATAVTIGQTAALTVQRVGSDGSTLTATTDAVQNDLSSAGNLILVAAAGGIDTLATGNVTANGQLLISAVGTSSDITLGASVTNTAGHTSLVAGRSIVQNANIIATSLGKTIELDATTGAVAMADGTSIQTSAGNLRVKASGDITVGQLDARDAANRSDGLLANQTSWGAISVLSTGGNILDNATESVPGNVDFYANELRLSAAVSAGGIGQSSNHLESEVAKFSVNVGTGGLFLTESSAITVGQTAGVVTNRVATNASTTSAGTTDALQSDLMSAGAAVLVTLNGNLTIDEGDTDTDTGTLGVQAAGNLFLQAGSALGNTSSNLILNADVLSTGGHISLKASQDIVQNADLTTSTSARTIDLVAARNITMAQDNVNTTVTVTSTNGDISLLATAGNITLETLNAGSGFIRLTAGLNIVDGDAAGDVEVDITAAGLMVLATGTTGAIGTGANHLEITVGTLSANAGSGGIYLSETDALSVDTVNVLVKRVDSTANTADQATSQADLNTRNNGNIVLVAKAGSITLNDGTVTVGTASTAVTANGSGSVLLDAQGASSDVVINANVVSDTGHLTIKAGHDINVGLGGAAVSVATATGGTIDLQTTTGAITMLGSSNVTATGSSLRLAAATGVSLGNLMATNVSVTAGSGAIANASGSTKNVSAMNLRLQAGLGVGTGARHISTAVDNVTVLSTGSVASAGIYLTEDNAITVTAVSVSVSEFTATAGTNVVTDAAQADLVTGNNGSIVLSTAAGSITLNDGNANGAAVSANGSGNILLQAAGNASDITVNADITSATGSISVLGGHSVMFSAQADIRSQGAGSTGSIDVVAGNGAVTQADNSLLGSTSGDIRVLAGTTITVGDISTLGNVSLTATTGSILDADVVTVTNDSNLNITASGLRLNAGMGVGQSINHLETTVATVSARATSGGIYLLESDGATVGDVRVTVNRVKTDGSVTGSTQSDAAQSDLITTAGNGNIVLTSTSGAITLNDGTASADNSAISAFGSGNILVQTLDAAGNITVNASVNSAGGHMSLNAGRNMVQNANISTTGSGTIDVRAGDSISMADGAVSTTGSGNIRYAATTTMTLGAISTGANVSLSASSITDSGSTETDVTANELFILTTGTAAGQGAGERSNHLELNVGKLAASVVGTGGLYLTEANDLVIGLLDAINVNLVGTDGATTQAGDSAQSKLSSAGNLILVTTTGSLQTLATGGAISAAGNLLVQAGGASSDITLGASVGNTAGHTSVNAGRSIVQNANITATGASKTIELIAGGAITMGAGAKIGSNSGNVLLNAGTDVTVEAITAGTANVAITAQAGNIIDLDTAGDALVDISANGLILKAGNGIGSGLNHLETSVTTVTASAGAGGIYLSESNGLTVDTVSVDVQRVNSLADSSTHPVPGVSQSDLTTTAGNGDIVLIAKAGSITLNDGAAGIAGNSVTANGRGTILVNAQGTGSDVVVQAKVQSTSGNITITASGTVTPGVVQTLGNVVTTGGSAVFTIDIDGKGQNIDVLANQVDISAGLTSIGASLNFAPLAAATPVAIVIGGADPLTALHLSLDEINLIQNGFAQINFGNGQANQSIVVQAQTTLGVASPVIFKDPLFLDLSGASSTLSVSGQLQGNAMTVQGTLANSTTTLTAADISMAGNVTVNGLIQVGSGNSVITAGNSSLDAVIGNLLITGNIVGMGGANETLSLFAEKDITVSGTISGIDGLNVTAAGNVTFNDTLAVTGNVVIDATGIVTFHKALTLSTGGTLTIRGATSVVFETGATATVVDGNITIDAQSLALKGGADSLSSHGGVLAITSATGSSNIMVGADVGPAGMVGSLNLTTREILAIGSGFSMLVIGKANTGAITLASNSDFTSVANTTAIDMRGASITVEAGGTVKMPGAITMTASGAITLNSGMSTAIASNLALVSTGGNVTMAASTLLSSSGGDVQVKAGDGRTVAISTIDTRSADQSQLGIVDLQAGSGTITDANNDSAVNVYAKALNFYGYGPDSAAAGNVIEVQAQVVRVAAPQGSVLRHADLLGFTHFNVINAGKLYEQIVVVSDVTRVTEDPNTLLTKDDATLIAAGLPATSSLLHSSPSQVSGVFGFSSSSQQRSAGNMTVINYLSAPIVYSELNDDIYLPLTNDTMNDDVLLSDSSYGIAARLQQSYVLGSPGEQPLISGLSTFSQGNYDYSVNTLTL
ncbi:hypothetical protein [Polaromonas sp. CG_9.11]|uniref:beta strand repeat-containing protein n=1 Tax=Polaromonas sp. CG_9.11 TaxID=2787730 RepID=UPI0018C9787B|nr:hypothetical protein [Polaromonas sp. CG_9.11]MBG6078024.1 hypothetical protein [Polaromonas sp. CG_9.11]